MCSKCRMHILLIYLLVCLYYDCARHIPLSVSLNQVSGSVAPKNLDYLGPKFLYISFISAASNAKTDHSLETCTAEQQCQVRNDALQYVQNSTLSAYTGEKVLHCQSRPSSGVTRRAGGPPRVTPSRGWHPTKIIFLLLHLERTLDKRRRKVGVVRRQHFAEGEARQFSQRVRIARNATLCTS